MLKAEYLIYVNLSIGHYFNESKCWIWLVKFYITKNQSKYSLLEEAFHVGSGSSDFLSVLRIRLRLEDFDLLSSWDSEIGNTSMERRESKGGHASETWTVSMKAGISIHLK